MKKQILILGILLTFFAHSIAMSSDKVNAKEEAKVKTHSCSAHDGGKHHNHSKLYYVHKLVDIYANDNVSAQKVGSIKFKERDDYSIFFCKENNWCEVVNQKDGSTGWISLDELKKAQEQYSTVIEKRNDFNQLSQFVQLQDQKIIQLQTVIMRMQKEFSTVLQQQQDQISQLQQSNYY